MYRRVVWVVTSYFGGIKHIPLYRILTYDYHSSVVLLLMSMLIISSSRVVNEKNKKKRKRKKLTYRPLCYPAPARCSARASGPAAQTRRFPAPTAPAPGPRAAHRLLRPVRAHTVVAPCVHTQRRRRGRSRGKKEAATAKCTMGPCAPDKELVGAGFFSSTSQNRAVRAQFPAALLEECFSGPVW